MNASTGRAYTTVDKSAWGEGPWQGEPDKIQWVDEATDLDCLIVRNPRGGNLCGYVGVPPQHSAHGKDYDDVRAPDEDGDASYIDVHGGLTYAGLCDEKSPEDRGICHVPLPGRAPDVWWLGFDCAHAWDVSPGRSAREAELGFPPMPSFADEHYRTVGYVRAQCARLARQLAAIA